MKLGQPKGHNIHASRATRAKGSAANAGQRAAFAERLRPVLPELDGLSANALRPRSWIAAASPPRAAASGRRARSSAFAPG